MQQPFTNTIEPKQSWLVQFSCVGLNFHCRVQITNSLAFSDDFRFHVFTVMSGYYSNAKPRPSFTWQVSHGRPAPCDKGPRAVSMYCLEWLSRFSSNGNTLITIIGNSSLVRDVCESLMVSVLVSVQGKYVWVRKSVCIFSTNKSGHFCQPCFVNHRMCVVCFDG